MAIIYEDHAKIFKAFCDEKRLRILELLRGGEKCAVSSGMTGDRLITYEILVESSIVEAAEGKWTHYKISEKGSTNAIALLKELTTANTVTEENNCCI